MLSALTQSRPDIWRRAVSLSASLTGMRYPHKSPLPGGEIYACGVPRQMPSQKRERIHEDISRYKIQRERAQERGDRQEVDRIDDAIKRRERELEELSEESPDEGSQTTASVVVPDGAMEWLLHEVGHWVASDAAERSLPNYGLSSSEVGHDGDREWQAWAFEEIVLAPFGQARHFAPPTQRDGAAFLKNGPMPTQHLRHAERRIAELRLPLEPWRIVWGDWVRWGRAHGGAPWKAES